MKKKTVGVSNRDAEDSESNTVVKVVRLEPDVVIYKMVKRVPVQSKYLRVETKK